MRIRADRNRLSKLVAAEMRYFNRRYAMSVLSCCTAIIALLCVLLTLFSYFGSTDGAENRTYLNISIGLAIALVAAYFTYRIIKWGESASYGLVMSFTAFNFVAAAFGGFLLTRPMWIREIENTRQQGFEIYTEQVLKYCFWLPLIAALVYLCVVFMPAKATYTHFGWEYPAYVMSPLLIFVALIMFLQQDKGRDSAISLAVVYISIYISLMLTLAVKYAAKAILNHVLQKLPDHKDTVVVRTATRADGQTVKWWERTRAAAQQNQPAMDAQTQTMPHIQIQMDLQPPEQQPQQPQRPQQPAKQGISFGARLTAWAGRVFAPAAPPDTAVRQNRARPDAVRAGNAAFTPGAQPAEATPAVDTANLHANAQPQPEAQPPEQEQPRQTQQEKGATEFLAIFTGKKQKDESPKPEQPAAQTNDEDAAPESQPKPSVFERLADSKKERAKLADGELDAPHEAPVSPFVKDNQRKIKIQAQELDETADTGQPEAPATSAGEQPQDAPKKSVFADKKRKKITAVLDAAELLDKPEEKEDRKADRSDSKDGGQTGDVSGDATPDRDRSKAEGKTVSEYSPEHADEPEAEEKAIVPAKEAPFKIPRVSEKEKMGTADEKKPQQQDKAKEAPAQTPNKQNALQQDKKDKKDAADKPNLTSKPKHTQTATAQHAKKKKRKQGGSPAKQNHAAQTAHKNVYKEEGAAQPSKSGKQNKQANKESAKNGGNEKKK